MRVFIAGAAGAIGTQLIPQLVARGHQVVGMTHSPGKCGTLRALGAAPVVADALDRPAVARAVAEARPEIVVHQLTALGGSLNMRRIDRFMAQTNRLRIEGTDHLLAAARAAGARRFIAQSFAGWPFARTGGPIKSEADPLDPHPPAALRATLDAIRHLESAVGAITWAEALVLRYATFYGPGTGISADPGAAMVRVVRKRQFPLVGGGTGYTSWVHLDDAAGATVLALEQQARGVFNIVDDEPAPASEWLPYLAECLGAKPPMRLPVWVARLAAGDVAVSMLTRTRGSSNARAKRELGWELRWPSWRQGFSHGLAEV
jgi:nucleoside-diphosphate-sugar epimerase